MFKRVIIIIITILSASCSVDNIKEENHSALEVGNISYGSQNFLRIKVNDELANRLENGENLFYKYGAKEYVRTFPYAGKFEKRTRAEGLHLWYDLYLDPESAIVKSSDISSFDGVEIVEYRPEIDMGNSGKATVLPAHNSAVRNTDAVFNDPMYPNQWHYKNTGINHQGVTISSFVKGCDMNVEPVWKRGFTGDSDVIVSVVDGGIDYTHEDLSDNIWVNQAEFNGKEGVDDDDNGYVDDIYGYNFLKGSPDIEFDQHGTHVAGTIAAVNNNGIGVCGIAGGNAAKGEKGVRVMSCQVIYGQNAVAVDHYGEAIKYGADNGAVISQNSWGYRNATAMNYPSDKEAIDYFIKYAGIDENGNQTGPMKGGVVIFAAGNSNRDYGYPAKYEKCISVSALGADYKRAFYSNFGDWISVAAPGGDQNEQSEILSTLPDNKYGYMQGTSQACPHVSGLAALIVSRYGGPGFTNEDLKARLLASTVSVDDFNPDYQGLLGKGIVDAMYAVIPDEDVRPSVISEFSASVQSNNISVKCVMPEADGIRTFGVNCYYSETEFSSDFDRENPDPAIKRYSVESLKYVSGTEVELQIPYHDIKFSTKYYLALDAYGTNRLPSEISDVFEVLTEENGIPSLVQPQERIIKINQGEMKDVSLKAEDPDGHKISISMESGNKMCTLEKGTSDGSYILKIDASDIEEGDYDIDLKIEDEFGAASNALLTLSVAQNTAPELLKPFDDLSITGLGKSVELDMNEYFRDRDELVFRTETSAKGVVSCKLNDNILKITSLAYESTDITVYAADPSGLEISDTFEVVVKKAGDTDTGNNDSEMTLFPNPARDYINIRTELSGIFPMKVFSISGTAVMNKDVELEENEDCRLELDSLRSGSYTLVIYSNGKQIKQQFVKI